MNARFSETSHFDKRTLEKILMFSWPNGQHCKRLIARNRSRARFAPIALKKRCIETPLFAGRVRSAREPLRFNLMKGVNKDYP
jgi:hypothetical protein